MSETPNETPKSEVQPALTAEQAKEQRAARAEACRQKVVALLEADSCKVTVFVTIGSDGTTKGVWRVDPK